jgi:hypothetical protein
MRSLSVSLACGLAALGILAITPQSVKAYWPANVSGLRVNGHGTVNFFGRPAVHVQANGIGGFQTNSIASLWYGSSATTGKSGPVGAYATVMSHVFSPYAGFHSTNLAASGSALGSAYMAQALGATTGPSGNGPMLWMDASGNWWYKDGIHVDARGNVIGNNIFGPVKFVPNNPPPRDPEKLLPDKEKKAKEKADRDAAQKKAAADRAEQQAKPDPDQAKEKEAEKLRNSEKDAGTLLTLARKLIDSNDRERAGKQLNAIIANYPNTKAAAEAKNLLKDL